MLRKIKMDYKICATCGETKNLTEFNRTKHGNLKKSCKVCVKARIKNYADKNAEKVKETKRKSYRKRLAERSREPEAKTCTSCGVFKLACEFTAFRSNCKQCVSEYNKKYRELNSERVSQTSKKWREENKAYLSEKKKEYVALNRPACRARVNKWDKANRATRTANLWKYRAQKRQASPLWADYSKIKEFYVSANGLSMLLGEWYHVDHIVPLQSEFVCGLHCEHNLQILPATENISKGNRWWPDMWEPHPSLENK